MRRRILALALVALPAVAFAQTPQPLPGTVTADAVEVVRVKPDQAKVYVTAASRNADAVTASDEAGEQAKKFADSVTRMKVKGLKAASDPVKVAKLTDERAIFRAGPGGVAATPTETQASQQVVVTITDADPKALVDAVEKVQREAIKEGLTGASDGTSLSTRSVSDVVKVAYLKDGMDALTAAALGSATKKASARAAAIADGLGLKLAGVVSAEEVPAGADPAAALLSSSLSRGTSAVSPAAELVEGELVRTVRVRVVYSVTK